MKIVILSMKISPFTKEKYCEFKEYEIESFEWGKGHKFEYVIKNDPFIRSLEDNQELVRLEV